MASFLTKNKDVNIMILSKLSFNHLREVLTVSKECSKYNSEFFWMNRLKYSEPSKFEIIGNIKERSWKDFALLKKKYFMSSGGATQCFISAAKKGHLDFVKYFEAKGASPREYFAFCKAVKHGHKDIIEYLISKGANDLNSGMTNAIERGHHELVEFFISKGADDWNQGLYFAAQEGDYDMIELMISKGANDWNAGMYGAARGNHLDLVEFFIAKGANRWETASWYAHDNLNEFFRKKNGKMKN